MINTELAQIFSEIADILEIKQDNPFKVRAYRKAALNVESYPRSVDDLTHKELLEIPGVGADIAAKIEEYRETGQIKAYEKLKSEVPPGIHAIMSIPDIGPKTALLIHEQLGIESLEDLEQAAVEHRLAGLRGIQQKTEDNILKGIAAVKRGRERQPLGRMLPVAMEIVEALQAQARVNRIEIAGSLRRRKETVKDIDLVATAPDPFAVMSAFVSLPRVDRVLMRGRTRSSITLRDGVQVDLRVVEPESFGAAMAYFTGSKQHNVRLREMAVKRGMKINEYGIFSKDDKLLGGSEEEDVYRLLDLPFIPAVLREDQGEIEAAQAGILPVLVELSDIRGDLHVHSRASDGAHPLEEIAAFAQQRGLSYVAITDHSVGRPGYARGLTVERLAAQLKEIDAFNASHACFRFLSGTEMDIQPDGSLDYPDAVLRELDVVVAAIHSAFKQTREQITSRIVAAMRNPYVSIIAHPTGRVIGEREAYEVDMEQVLQVAAETGTALEINSYPLRLDVSDTVAKRAKELGVPIAINTDMHVLSMFETLPYGISVAQRGWLEKGDVLNTLEPDELLQRLRKKRGKR
ncbi:DNA polymerase/3'-5' exonuclease PolX [Geomesophilobacter sediminis]|uniref:DNA polymerase beta n=1 Tax=Geomesophilobacter sediminis TaxID=2798584 RepID=A0A8J7JMR6_9BACT|nr:DNA polymerase/3'-5' exonuclease PolX [Geomesophilobacter sediminis]MBJ6726240.1 DNA polymerase/3'-5' exonuclease PolX [Geomesophilobacter sediminis]